MNNLRLVVFDMDGTLIDSQDVIIAAMGRAFTRLGMPAPSAEQTRASIGLSLDKAVSTIAPNLSPTEVNAGVEAYRQSFVEMRAESGGEAVAPMYPGALAAFVNSSGIAFMVRTFAVTSSPVRPSPRVAAWVSLPDS